ncbi:MAG: hypothetical protein KL801_07160 [Mesorhizobium sp.]|nr:hypothetical protein [Mesorhizobium sp.]
MTVAYAELTRVLPWSLRALGYTFGTADRGAHFVTKAAALDPNVLDLIARAQKRRQGRMRHQQSNGKLTIDAAGMSLFEAGPAAIDYLAAHAGDAPTVACEIVGASEPSLLSALLIDAADYGICAVATSAESPDGWQAIWPRVDGAVLVQGRTVDALSDLLGGEPSIMEQLEVHRFRSAEHPCRGRGKCSGAGNCWLRRHKACSEGSIGVAGRNTHLTRNPRRALHAGNAYLGSDL